MSIYLFEQFEQPHLSFSIEIDLFIQVEKASLIKEVILFEKYKQPSRITQIYLFEVIIGEVESDNCKFMHFINLSS